jgi:hypothetical protein
VNKKKQKNFSFIGLGAAAVARHPVLDGESLGVGTLAVLDIAAA